MAEHFMVDLETLGTSPGCAILSIGVVAFDPQANTLEDFFVDDGLYVVVDRQSCLDAMLHVDQSTVDWWNKQGGAARQVLSDCENKEVAVPLAAALIKTVDYVAEQCSPKNAKIYGNGADFDNPILSVASRHANIRLPWSYGGRCYRTLKNLNELFGGKFTAPALQRGGTYHNALDDARTQAEHLFRIIQQVRKLR